MKKHEVFVQTHDGKCWVDENTINVAARQYCQDRGLVYENLDDMFLYYFDEFIAFAEPTGIVPNGLMNDLKTQPYPTLILWRNGSGFQFEETEHTLKYLSAPRNVNRPA